MELQRELHRLEVEHIAFYAISYDEPAALRAFSEEHSIRFSILSDADSEIIRRFGILNTLVPDDDHPWHGIPFPGAYVIDSDGTIVAKFFENNLMVRPTAEQLRRAATGTDVSGELELRPAETTAPEAVEVEIAVSDEPLPTGMLRDLVVTFRIPKGQHLYGEPVPDGMVATQVELDEGLVVRPTQYPPSRTHTLAGTGEVLQVFDGSRSGVVRLVVPFTHTLLSKKGGETVRLRGTVRWQSCDDQSCSLPQQRAFEFSIPAAPTNIPHYREVLPGQMDFNEHFAVLNSRRGLNPDEQ